MVSNNRFILYPNLIYTCNHTITMQIPNSINNRPRLFYLYCCIESWSNCIEKKIHNAFIILWSECSNKCSQYVRKWTLSQMFNSLFTCFSSSNMTLTNEGISISSVFRVHRNQFWWIIGVKIVQFHNSNIPRYWASTRIEQ